MKYNFLISLSFAVILFSACQKEENMYTPDSIAQSEAMKKGKAVANLDSSLNAYPQIRFKFGGKNNQLVRVVLFDSLFKNYDDLKVDVEVLPHSNSDLEKEASTVKPYVRTTAYAQVGVDLYMLRSEPVPYTESFIGKIVDVKLSLISNGQKVDSKSFSVFVFENGKSALQKPEIKKAHFWDDWQGETGYIKLEVKVENDPAEQVAAVEVVFDEKTASPAPISFTNYLKSYEKRGNICVLSGTIRFKEDPTGQSYTISVALLDKNGVALNNPETITTKIPLKAKPSIHNIYIRELKDANGKLTHQMAGLVLNIKPERLDYVEVTFNEPFEGPAPATIIWRMRKRPEILYQAWDAVINDYISEIQNNPLYFGSETTVVNPLFEKSAAGYSYNVSASAFDRNGNRIGRPLDRISFKVTVSGETDLTNPEVLSTRIFSTDKGLTWTVEVKAADKGAWVEKVQLEFIKPYSVAIPYTNPLSLNLSKEEPGNMETYTFTGLKFEGEPTLGELPIKIQFSNGSGTKNASSQTSIKPELL